MPSNPPRRTMRIAFRVAPDELARIDELATQRGLNRTDYVIACALGQRDDAGEDFNEQNWREQIEDRLGRIERLALGLD